MRRREVSVIGQLSDRQTLAALSARGPDQHDELRSGHGDGPAECLPVRVQASERIKHKVDHLPKFYVAAVDQKLRIGDGRRRHEVPIPAGLSRLRLRKFLLFHWLSPCFREENNLATKAD